MSGLVGNPFLLTSAGAAGYQISRSLRFNSSDSAYCSRTFTTPTASNRWTWAGWIKRVNTPAVADVLFSANYSSGLDARLSFASDNTFLYTDGGGPGGSLQTAAVYRDFSSWMHVVFVYDSPNATSTDRLQLYINGTRITTANGLGSATYPTQNTASSINGAKLHTIGQFATVTGYYANMYLADVHFIDGQALTPSSFTEVSATTGQLIPKPYTGSFGTNGFWLKFSDNSAATATTLGKDYSGNSNNWTPNNLSVEATSQLTPYLSGGTIYNDPFNANWTWAANQQGYTQGSVNSVQVDFPVGKRPVVNSSVVVVYGSYNNAATTVQCTITYTDATTSVGTNVSATNKWLEAETFTVASTKTISQIKIEWISGDASKWPNLGPITVDGVRLVNSGAGNDSLVDTPTSYGTDTGAGGQVRGNYCTWNPLDSLAGTLSNGNLDSTSSGSGIKRGTVAVSSGKWYWEVTVTSAADRDIGIARIDSALTASAVGTVTGQIGYYCSQAFPPSPLVGTKIVNGSSSNYGAYYVNGDTVGVALNLDAGEVTFYVNGVSQGVAATGLTGTWTAAHSAGSGAGANMTANFGQRPFAYTAPSGFKALCDTNLPAPVVAKPSTVMDVKLWTGNSGTQTISGLGFSPDLIWAKVRNATASNQLFDVIRGVNKALYSDLTSAEFTDTDAVTAFNSDGWTMGAEGGLNFNGNSYVAWTWDAGSSTVTNTQGSITSSVRANVSAGFSIVTYTGTATTGSQTPTVGHGLNVTPKLVITKRRDGASDWVVQTDLIPQNYLLYLNSTAAQTSISGSGVSNIPLPTSSVFTAAYITGLGVSGQTHVAYCFAPVAGYSSMGSWSGSGNADGPFIYTGFRPKLVIWKNITSAENWVMMDTGRDPSNVASNYLFPNSSAAEGTTAIFDILSNGFKMRNTFLSSNSASNTYIYCAWAESPFQYARAR